MKVKKILNNNVILAVDSQQKEKIVMGKAIGYHYKTHDDIDESQVEKMFVLLDTATKENYMHILATSPTPNIILCNEIIEYGKSQIDTELSDCIFVTLLDHINFAIQRYEKGIHLQNRLYWDVKMLYPKEFLIGQHAVEMINESLKVHLLDEEASNIALHFVNAETGDNEFEKTVAITNIVKDSLHIITYHYQKELDESSMNFSRLVTHLQFFAQRILEHSTISENDDFLYNQVKKKYPQEYECALKIEDYIIKNYQQMLTHDEIVYLCIHLHRVYSRSK
ncbi:MAG: BglG family transcription antiterminator LicT [Longibaculum sp.]